MVTPTAGVKGLVPFTCAHIDASPDWRGRIHWPVAHQDFAIIGQRVPEAAITFVASLKTDLDRQTALVAAPIVVGAFMSALEAAWVADRAADLDLDVLGGPAEMSLLATGRSAPAVGSEKLPGSLRPAPIRHSQLRALARTWSWTPVWRLPAALIAPEAYAITHNKLLARQAKSMRIGCLHATEILRTAQRKVPGRRQQDTLPLAEGFAAQLVGLASGLRETFQQRLLQVVQSRLSPLLAAIAADVAAIRGADLPHAIWSGTNGAYPSRLIASEVRRRGGSVDVFDHGGVVGISQLPASTALIELSTSSRFWVATPQWAELLGRTDALRVAEPVNRPTIVGGGGEPTFDDARRNSLPGAGRPRVIYVGHPYRELRQFPLVGMPDALYLDFQMHVVEELQRLNLDLLLKPHPEGFYSTRSNPLEAMASTSHKRFEDHLDDADIFLFDAPTSTTFYEALCTRRHVVLVDRGYAINPELSSEIGRRVTIVPTQADSRNRLRIDRDQLTAALLSGRPAPDPDFFRVLATGQH